MSKKQAVRKSGVLPDSNLLLLLVVGSFNERLIPSFKRLNQFTIADFYLLRDFIRPYRVYTTPHVLTEVGNLANALPSQLKLPFLVFFASVITSLLEVFSPSAELGVTEPFSLFGITDAALCASAPSTIVLTEDGRLRSYLQRQGRTSLNLIDIRRARQAGSAR